MSSGRKESRRENPTSLHTFSRFHCKGSDYLLCRNKAVGFRAKLINYSNQDRKWVMGIFWGEKCDKRQVNRSFSQDLVSHE